MKRKISVKGRIFIIVSVLLAVEGLLLFVSSKLFPKEVLLFIGLVFGELCLIEIALFNNPKRKKVKEIAGVLIASILIGFIIVENVYLYRTMELMRNAAAVDTQASQVGIYVRKEDPATDIEDTAHYLFGIIHDLDRDNTDQTIAKIKEETGFSVQTRPYEAMEPLIQALLNESCGAIIINDAYISLLKDMPQYEDLDSKIRKIGEKVIETEIKVPVSSNSNAFQVYISGIDSGGEKIINTNSDVNIIATINPDTKQILLVSTPRDYYVPLPISGDDKDKLTHAGIYGIDVSMGALNLLYDIQLDYYLKVNFAGFMDIIDSLGEIDVYSEYEFDVGTFHYEEGLNHLSGIEALAFARERYSFISGDRQRGKNQMAVIKAVANKISTPSFLLKYGAFLDTVDGSFETSMPYDVIADLAQKQLESGDGWEIVSYSVNGSDDIQKTYSQKASAYVMQPNEETVMKAMELMHKVLTDEKIDGQGI